MEGLGTCTSLAVGAGETAAATLADRSSLGGFPTEEPPEQKERENRTSSKGISPQRVWESEGGGFLLCGFLLCFIGCSRVF